MAVPPVDRDELLLAMRQFDHEQRDAPEWSDWESNKAHRFAIEHDGRRYPVKRVISLATGAPVSDFSGGAGAGQANAYAEAREFRVVELHTRNPPWARDELILALDLYLRHRDAPPGHESAPIHELSEILNRLGVHLHAARYERYRNANGVYMKLMNFRSLDPAWPAATGLPNTGRLDREIWNEFADDPAWCHEAAEAIRQAIEALDEDNAEVPEFDEGFIEAEEGRAVTRLHVRRERNRKIVQRKKQSVLKRVGQLVCEACGFEFKAVYGDRGDGFIECHHVKPVSELKAGERTKLQDLRIVCANCHRMIHARRPWLTIEDLKALPGVKALGDQFGHS